MFTRPKVNFPVFDGVASEAIKATRKALNDAARNKLAAAATAAIAGDVNNAFELRHDADTLKNWAITIPLDMIEMEKRGVEPFSYLENNQD